MNSITDFEILKRLGEGSFGTVYQVKRKSDGKIYAMKKVKMLSLSTKEKENALNEVRILASIKSPYVISYKEAFYDDASSCLCIIMDFASKGDVLMKINEKKRNKQFFEEPIIWKFASDMLLGLKALHDKKILHRDLKGANVFISEEGALKLGDLNVSKVQKKDYAYTQTGTPYYTSPEVWQNRPYDSKCDVWSFGCVLYEVATLEPPFKGISLEDLCKRVLRGNFAPINLQKYSSDLQKFIETCLKVVPKDRASIDQLITHKKILPFVDIDSLAASDRERELNKKNNEKNTDLLQTIKLPFGNLKGLNNRLPKANYEPEEVKSDQIQNKKQFQRPLSANDNNQVNPQVPANNNPNAVAPLKRDSSQNKLNQPSSNPPILSNNLNALVSPKRELSQNKLNNNNNNNAVNNPQYNSPGNQRIQSAQVKRVLSQNDLNPSNGGKNYMPPVPQGNYNYNYQSPFNPPKIVSDNPYNQVRGNSRDQPQDRGRKPSLDGNQNYRNNSNSKQQQPNIPQSPSVNQNQKLQPLPPKPQNPAGMPSSGIPGMSPAGLPPKGRFGY